MTAKDCPGMCAGVCVCVCARVRMCVCVCARARARVPDRSATLPVSTLPPARWLYGAGRGPRERGAPRGVRRGISARDPSHRALGPALSPALSPAPRVTRPAPTAPHPPSPTREKAGGAGGRLPPLDASGAGHDLLLFSSYFPLFPHNWLLFSQP